MSCDLSLLVGNTLLIQLRGLTDAAGQYVNDADVTVTITTRGGAPVSGQQWPLPMAHIAGSSGDYQALLTHELGLIELQAYRVVIRAQSAAGSVFEFERQVVARTRPGC